MTNSNTDVCGKVLCEKIAGSAIMIDRGRIAAQAQGLSQSGAMDEKAYLWANHLLQNPINAATLELAVANVRLRFDSDTTVALCGASRSVLLNETPMPMWHSFKVKAGDVLSIAWPNNGIYSYLAIAGGFEVERFFDSASCVVREKLGGHNHGQALQKCDVLRFAAQQYPMPLKAVPYRFRYDEVDDSPVLLRVIPCYQFESFSEAARTAFFSQTYSVSNLADRMGYRLDGAPIALPDKGIISEPIALGSVQIANNGLPMVLMRDRQNIGGYPKIGTVVSMDIEKLAQCTARRSVRFLLSDVETIWRERVARETFFKQRA